MVRDIFRPRCLLRSCPQFFSWNPLLLEHEDEHKYEEELEITAILIFVIVVVIAESTSNTY